MKLEQKAAPTELPISIDQIRKHLVLDTFDDDALLEIYLAQAVAYCEARSGMHIGSQTWSLYGDTWCDIVTIPLVPVTDIQVQYLDTEGVLKYLDNSLFTTDIHSFPAKIFYTDMDALPETQDVPNNVIAEITTGFTDNLPRTLEAAIQLVTGHLYERREDSSHVQIYGIPRGADAFLDMARLDLI